MHNSSSAKKQITKIVITGGPCAGKTSGMSHIKDYFSKLGYYVIFIPETATELISGGVAPWTLESNVDYQLCQIKLQVEKEKIFDKAANKILNSDKILIVCDRGVFDNKAYMTDSEFEFAMEKLKLKNDEVMNTYNAVFHLVTAAKGAESFYTLSNNEARKESVEEAAALDDKLIEAWAKHPYLKIIGNDGNFDEKMKKLTEEISLFLNEQKL